MGICMVRLAVYLFDSIGVLQTPLAGWLGFPETPAVYRVTRNRRLADACLMDGIAEIW